MLACKAGEKMLEVDLTQVTLALSYALDLVGVETLQHGKRVALLSLECARHLGFTPEERHRLLLAAVLHDCGVSSTELHRQIISHFDWEASRRHAEGGYELLRSFPPFADLAQVVRHHHDHWDALLASQVPRHIALQSNLIFLADRVDALLQLRVEGLGELPAWAAYHHEAISGNGYPFHRGGKEVSESARIVAIADVFQALAQNRPYRKGLSLDQILEVLREMAEEGKLDPALVALAAQHGPAFMGATALTAC